MDAAYLLAENLIKVKYADLPEEVVDVTKKQVMDILGVMLGGSSRPGIRELAELIGEWGGKEESTVACFGKKVPAPNAAQVNSSMGHALDYDDTGEGPTHPSVVIVPTCLAVAEHRGGISGSQFITAVALGTDMFCRMGASFRLGQKGIPIGGHPGAGWHLTAIYGYLAAAGAAGKILGLDKERLVNALGIAYHQSAGNGQCVNEGALTKRMGPGFSSRGGIVAALMAEKGITGAKDCLEGELGIYNLYHQGQYDPGPLKNNLGKQFYGKGVGMKPYPCCKGSHGYADVALALVAGHDIQVEEVEEITIFCPDETSFLLSPLDKRSHPQNPVDAQFSIPWVVSAIIARKRASVGDFTEEAIRSPDILKMSGKIRIRKDSSLSIGPEGMAPAKIAIKMRNGSVYLEQQAQSDSLSSQTSPPFSVYERKFRDCISYSIKPFSDRQIEKILNRVKHLEQMENVSELTAMLG
jgi:2-methylcitrate dehydratase PrpD